MTSPAAASAVTPIAPKFNDTNGTVYINEQHGVRFHIDVDGTEVTKDGMSYARPGTYTAEHGMSSPGFGRGFFSWFPMRPRL